MNFYRSVRILFFLFLTIFPFQEIFSQNYTVAVLYWSSNIEGQKIMRTGIEETFSKYNKSNSKKINILSYVAGDGEKGVENQINQFFEAIEKNPQLIIVQPTDNAALVKPLKVANQKNIPVIAYDQYIVEGKLESYVTSNNYQAGYLNGEYISSLYPKGKIINLVLVEYPMVSSTVERVNGFLDALTDSNRSFKIVKTYVAVEPVAGKMVAKQILVEFPLIGSVDAIFSVNDGAGVAIANEIYKAGRVDLKLASIDGDPENIKNLKDKKVIVSNSAQFCFALGEKTAMVSIDFLNGLKIPKKILVPTFPVNKETLSLFPGWQGAIPNQFEMVWKPGSSWDNSFKIFEK